MALFGGSFSEYLNLPWEQARTFVAEEFEQLRNTIQSLLGKVFDADGRFFEDAFEGSGATVPSYLANTGTDSSPKWEKVDLAAGVKNRLKYINLPAGTTSAQSVIGFVSGQDFQEVYVRNSIPDLEIVGDQLVLQETGVTPGTYGSVTVDIKGRVTAGTVGSDGAQWSVLTNGNVASPELIFAGGDVIMLEYN